MSRKRPAIKEKGIKEDATSDQGSVGQLNKKESKGNETSEWTRIKFEIEKNEEILSRYDYIRRIEIILQRRQSCKTVYRNNKRMMHDLRWCKLNKEEEENEEQQEIIIERKNWKEITKEQETNNIKRNIEWKRKEIEDKRIDKEEKIEKDKRIDKEEKIEKDKRKLLLKQHWRKVYWKKIL